jgi:hypothetical protein
VFLPLGNLGDAGGSGNHVMDEVAVELDVSRAQYEVLRERLLDHMGLLPHDAAPVAHRLGQRTWTTAGHVVTQEERNAALQTAEWWPAWWDNRPPGVGVMPDGPFKDIYVDLPPLAVIEEGRRVLHDPNGRTTFRVPYVDGIYGPESVHWVDLPPGSFAIVRYPHSWIPDELLAGAPVFEIPLWKAWGCDDWQNACSRSTTMTIVPATRIGVSAGDRHAYRLLQTQDGRPIGYIGWYETGASGNFFQTGIGKFIARELAAGIVEVVVTIVGTVVTAGFGSSGAYAAGSAAGSGISSLISSSLDSGYVPFAGPYAAQIVRQVGSVPAVNLIDSKVTEVVSGTTGVTASVAIETAYQINPKMVDQGFADLAILTTYFAGFDDLVFGFGSFFRAMVTAMQADPASFARELARHQAQVNGFGGELLGYARMLVLTSAKIFISLTPAAPFVAAITALEQLITTAYGTSGSGVSSQMLMQVGSALLSAAAELVPAGGQFVELASEALKAAASAEGGNWSSAGKTLVGVVGDLIPEVGSALAAAGRLAITIADTQDKLRQIELAQDRERAARDAYEALRKKLADVSNEEAETKAREASVVSITNTASPMITNTAAPAIRAAPQLSKLVPIALGLGALVIGIRAFTKKRKKS